MPHLNHYSVHAGEAASKRPPCAGFCVFMPSTSKKQAHFMAAVAHGWKPTSEKGPPVSVAKEFHAADKKAGKWEHPGRMERLKSKGKR